MAPEVIYYVASSLDGYIATPDGGLEWLAPFASSNDDYGYAAFYDSVDSVIVGRRTFEQSLTFGDWPYPGKPVWVMSSGALGIDREGVTVTADAPDVVLGKIEGRGLKRVWLVGGGTLAGSFRQAGLISEYIVSVIPVILGAGVPLFGAGGPQQPLHLMSATPYADGVCQLSYAPA